MSVTSAVRRLGRTRWFARLGRAMSGLDRRLQKATRGRLSVLGKPTLPQLILTTTGRKTGEPREAVLLYAVDGDGWVLIGSNWGQEHHPAWSGNLLANPSASVTITGVTTPVTAALASDDERARLLPALLTVWPAYETYAARASARELRVFRLITRLSGAENVMRRAMDPDDASHGVLDAGSRQGGRMTLDIRSLTPFDEAAAARAHQALRGDGFEFLLGWSPGTDWASYLDGLAREQAGTSLAEGRVPATLLVAVVDDDIVGRLSVRHELNAFLLRVGGNIGYAVVPEARGRGYATAMLRHGLGAARIPGREARAGHVRRRQPRLRDRHRALRRHSRGHPRRQASLLAADDMMGTASVARSRCSCGCVGGRRGTSSPRRTRSSSTIGPNGCGSRRSRSTGSRGSRTP